jgi:hypothetical protein
MPSAPGDYVGQLGLSIRLGLQQHAGAEAALVNDDGGDQASDLLLRCLLNCRVSFVRDSDIHGFRRSRRG